jgi:hypothetical protein
MQRFIRIVLLCFLTGIHIHTQAQDGGNTGLIKGRLVGEKTKQPISDVQLTIPAIKQLVNTDAEGNFLFSRVPYGTHLLIIGGQTVIPDTIKVDVHSSVADLNDIVVRQNDSNASPLSLQIPTIALEDNNISSEDDGVRTANVSGLISAARDPFLSAAAFVFGPYRFQPRGFTRGAQEVQINGTPMNDVETGDAYWAQWGGLNDVFRSRSNTYGLQPSEYAFGDINGSVYFDAAASSQRKQTRITYSLANRNYRNRLVFTKSSGLMKNGWAYSVSVSRRWAKEGYVPGTFYDGWSYYAGVSKQLNKGKHEFNLITFGAPTRRGKSAPVTQETIDIAGDNFYNPNWGYQNGEKRNAKVANNFQPTTILNYEYHPSNTMRWVTTLSYQMGKNKNSSLDYYNGFSPRPDYYRYMPSSFVLDKKNPDYADFYQRQQIDWNGIYNVNYINYDSVKDANGISGNTVYGRRSVFALYNDVQDIRKYTFNTTLEKSLSEHITLNTGLQFIAQRTENYREMADLLGGDYYLNLNQFATDVTGQNYGYNQFDLNTPNRVIHKGDKYDYDFIDRFTKGFVWAQLVGNFNKVDLFAAAKLGYNDFSREGLYKNGLFPNASYGKGDVQRFTTYNLKGGLTYKIDGRNFLFANAGYAQSAPEVDNTYISPRTRSLTVPNPTVEKISSLEAGYLKRTPKYNLRAVGYAVDIVDATAIKRYYNDLLNTFVNYVMQGISTRNTGLELAGEVKVTTALSVTGVASISQAFYTKNPSYVGVYNDNDSSSTPLTRQVYIKNYYVAAGPQSAYTLGFNYRSKQYWWASINFNYFERNYVDISPDQRSADAIAGVPVGSELYHRILDQQVLPSAFTVDIFASKSLLLSKVSKSLPRGTFLYINAGISNLLDAKVVTGGFEQLRYDFADTNPSKFDTKYFYGFGRNFFINLSLKF